MSYNGYANQIEFIKAEYGNYYIDMGPENGVLQGTKYAGAATHARNCLYTLTKMLKPKYALEIGSMHYASSDSIANAMNFLKIDGIVDSFDIKRGGYTGEVQYTPNNKKVRPGYWYPFKTTYDQWKYNDPGIVFKEFKDMSQEEIRKKNEEILTERTKQFGGKYDLIFIDGDHSYEGANEDFNIALKFAHRDTVIVIDNVWDIRLNEVRKFYDDLKTIKWDFEEWNDKMYSKNIVMDNAVSLTY